MERALRATGFASRSAGICLALAVSVQTGYLVSGTVARVAARSWVVRGAPAVERSAQIAFGDEFADFMSFVRENVPVTAKLVVPPKGLDPLYGDIGMMQYFLRPRRIIDCPLGVDLAPCIGSLTGKSTYLLAVPGFPPLPEAGLNRHLIAFNGERGVYAPRAPTADAPGFVHDAGAEKAQLSTLTWLLDLAMVACMLVLGVLAIRAVLPDADPMLVVAGSIPLGVAAWTFLMFLLAWGGVPLNLWAVGASGLALGAIFIIPARMRRLHRERSVREGEVTASVRAPAPSAVLGWITVLTLLGISLVLSVARSYSGWDDMAAYAVQGYGIARDGTLEASRTWGPSAASYPLNLQLAISVFHLLDGDVLPGSKLVFPMFLAAILLAGYRTWRRAGQSDLWAAALTVGLGTIPLVLDHSTTGYTNLPFTAYLVLGCSLALEGALEGKPRMQFLGGLFLASAIWTRPEGFLVVGGALPLLLILMARMARGRGRAAAIVLPPALVWLCWLAYGASGLSSSQMATSLRAVLESWAQGSLHLDAPYWTLRYLGRSLIDPAIWGFMLPLALFFIVLGAWARGVGHHELPVGLVVAGCAVGAAILVFFYLVSFASPLQPWLGTSVERMFLPAGVLAWIGLGGLSSGRRIAADP